MKIIARVLAYVALVAALALGFAITAHGQWPAEFALISAP